MYQRYYLYTYNLKGAIEDSVSILTPLDDDIADSKLYTYLSRKSSNIIPSLRAKRYVGEW